MISVRGTSEAAGTGSANGGRTYASGGAGATLSSLIGYANSEPYLPVYQEAISYPAVILPATGPTLGYISSVQTGITNLVGEINSVAGACPYTNIILAGYSQGADVIDESVGLTHSSLETVPALSSAALDHITSVLLFGDPRYRPGEAWDAAGDGIGGGILEAPTGQFVNNVHLTYLPPNYDTLEPSTYVQSYCFTGDEFCQSNFTPAGATIHGSYGASTVIGNAWVFFMNWVTDN
ncbi:MAG: cutinase [Actinomycetota bacterium]|jgi:hypothetical protein|nr:cutinase [Actinomycetota bacterium]